MGLIKFGGGVAGISGKIGGTVYARNKSGAYARNWTKPVNPGSVPQSDARANLAAAVAGWATRTNEQQLAWNAYAAGMTRLNRLGESYVPSGRQIYIEQFINMFTALLVPLSVPGPSNVQPSINQFALGNVESSAVTNLYTGAIVKCGGVIIPSGAPNADCPVFIYAAPAHSTGVTNVNKQRRLILQDDATAIIGELDVAGQLNAYFGGSSNPGRVLDVWARVLDSDTGLASPMSYAFSVIGTA